VIYQIPLWANEKKEGEGAAAPIAKEEKEFLEKSSKLNSLTTKIVESEKHFNELVHHKNEAKDSAEKQRIIQEMVEVANQRNKDVEAYNKLKSDIALRYPNQGEKLNRRYQTQSKRSIEELEGVAGLDELLTRTKKVVERKFAPFMEDEPKEEKKAHVVAPEDEKPKRLKLEK
jgi:hypothetical protein